MSRLQTNRKCLAGVFAGGILCGLLFAGQRAEAAEHPAYTITKGKRATISTILKKNPLTSAKQSKYRGLKWKSTNKKVVKIVNNNKIKGIKKGKVYIRGYNKRKKRIISIRVTVGKKVSKIQTDVSSVSLAVGVKKKLAVTVSPVSASNKKVFYSSSNAAVAKISKSGMVTTAAEGSSVITITSKDGHAKKKVKVKVQPELVRKTTKGAVKGITDAKGTALVWYGIPYGQSTAGSNRWKAPQPVVPWSGTLQATAEKPPAAQYSDGTTYYGTEDCLYVNVYRPNNANVDLPVMVFLHGGGNASGNANVNFSKMAVATNTVVVSVEYRLGAFGYLSHPALRTGTEEENSGNFTLLDIKASLLWVRDEIANFGGNPWNVTLSGFSAGARNALLCMISPGMNGLFHKAIIFSGGCNICTNEEGEESVEGKLVSILVKRGTFPDKKTAQKYIELASDMEIRSLFQSLSTSEVANMYKPSGLRLGKFPHGFNDGVVIPKSGFSVIQSGNYNRVPILLGSDATEFSAYAWKENVTSEIAEAAGNIDSARLPELVAEGVKYGSLLQSGHYIEKTASLLNQDPAHAPVYAYRFKWGTDAGVTDDFYSRYVGAFHGASKDFLRGFYKNSYAQYSPNAISDQNLQGRTELTSLMQKYIGNFLLTGNPNDPSLANWGTWNSVPGMEKIMIFDANKTQSTSGMSSEYYDEEQTFQQMRASLPKAEYDVLVKSLFEGRFFMPEKVPEY